MSDLRNLIQVQRDNWYTSYRLARMGSRAEDHAYRRYIALYFLDEVLKDREALDAP